MTGDVNNLFGAAESEIIGTKLKSLIPAIPDRISKDFFANNTSWIGRGKNSRLFPVIIKVSKEKSAAQSSPGELPSNTLTNLKDEALINLRISSLQKISGLVVIRPSGLIHSINPIFSKHLFGYEESLMVNQEVTFIFPTFWKKFDYLIQNPDSHSSLKFNHFTSSHMNLSDFSDSSITSIEALHSDGTLINVHISIRPNHGFQVLWVSFGDDIDVAPSKPLRLNRQLNRRYTAPSKCISIDKPRNSFHASLPFSSTDLNIDSYKIIKKLGDGGYGFVRLAFHEKDPEQCPVVIKYVLKSTVLRWVRRPDIGGRVPVELAILYDLTYIPHRCIPKLLTSFQDEFYNYIIMPYTAHQDLFNWIETSSPSEDDLKYIFAQILSAVYHLHNNGIVHRDIKVKILALIPRMKIL